MPGPGHGEPWSCATARARATLSSAGPTVLPSTIGIITVAMLNGMDNDFVTLDAQREREVKIMLGGGKGESPGPSPRASPKRRGAHPPS